MTEINKSFTFLTWTEKNFPRRTKNEASREQEYFLILYILENYQFRISEVLRLTTRDLLQNYKIAFKLSKSKNYEIIRDVELWNLLSKNVPPESETIFSVTYKQIVGYIKRNAQHLILRRDHHSRKITHSPRYKEAQLLKSKGYPPKLIQAALHHDSINSQKYYYNKKKT